MNARMQQAVFRCSEPVVAEWQRAQEKLPDFKPGIGAALQRCDSVVVNARG